MSDTPETDHAALLPKDGADWRDVVLVEFARQLERERDAIEKELFHVRGVLLDAMPRAFGSTTKLAEMLAQERDRYQEQADALVDRLGATQERMIDAERERDAYADALSRIYVIADDGEEIWSDIEQISAIAHNALNKH